MANSGKGVTDLVCIRKDVDVEMIKRLKQDLLDNDYLIGLALLLALAGNDTRLKILYLLSREKELCVCDLADVLEMTVPAVSQQLRKLKDKNLVQRRRDGQTLYYSLQDSRFIRNLKRFFSGHQLG